MKITIASVFTIILLCACQNDNEAPQSADTTFQLENISPTAEFEYNTGNWQKYTNKRYHFGLEYPEQWWVAENKGTEGSPVINIYSAAYDDLFDLPLTIHEDPLISHVSFFPEGSKISEPYGTAVNIAEIDAPITFDPDSSESVAYQHNDGEIWGYYLKPKVLPTGWTREGYIFVQISVHNAEVKCFNSSGKEKSIRECNTLAGDRMIKYGTVNKTDRRLINHMLSTLYFTDSENNRRPIAELIQLEQMSMNDTITSPAVIKGNARGMWFDEGRFPVILKDKNHRTLSKTAAVATDNWLTSGLVPFEFQVSFKNSYSGQAYLLFMQANASDRSSLNRGYILPVILSDETEHP